MMGGNRGKGIPTSGSNEHASQQQHQNVMHATSLSTTPSIKIISENTAQAATENFSSRLISILPLQSMMDMQSSFSQLPTNQRREFLNWMMSNLNTPEVDMITNQIQNKQPAQSETKLELSPGKIKSEMNSESFVVSTPWPDANKLPVISNSSCSIVNPSQAGEVLTSLTVHGMPYNTAPVSSSGSTISYVPLLSAPVSGASTQVSSGITYATPVYSTDLVGDNITYVQPVHESRGSVGSSSAQVIGHVSELQGNGEINIVVPNSQPATNTNSNMTVANSSGALISGDHSGIQQVIDADGNVTNVMFMPETAQTLEGSNPAVSNTFDPNQHSVIVFKQVKKSEDTGAELEAETSTYTIPKKDDSIKSESDKKSSKKFRKTKRFGGRRSPCLECKKYFQLVPDETKRGRIWREKTHVCQHCSKMFRTKGHLKVHERIHTGIKPYACSHCSKTFAQSSAAKAHCLLHTMPKPFTCSICNKSMTTKGNLKLHMALHTGQKPFECSYCPKTFPRKSNLDQHLLTHTGERPFCCQHCKKGFRTMNARKTHERIHTGEKPFSCQYCLKSFSDRRNLKSHERIHTGGFGCNFCGKHFSDRRRVKSHVCSSPLQKSKDQPPVIPTVPTTRTIEPQIEAITNIQHDVNSVLTVLPTQPQQHILPLQQPSPPQQHQQTQLHQPQQHQQQNHQQQHHQQHHPPQQQPSTPQHHQIISM